MVELLLSNLKLWVIFVLLILVVTLAKYYGGNPGNFPGPRGLPFVGNILDLIVSPDELLHRLGVKWPQLYGPVYRIFIGITPCWVLTSPEAAQAILGNANQTQRSPDYSLMCPWLGNGLATNSGEVWKRHRHILHVLFHKKALKDYLQIFHSHSRLLNKKLFNGLSEGHGKFNVYDDVSLCTLDIIYESATGVCLFAQERCDSEYVRAVYKGREILHKRVFSPWLWPDVIFRFTTLGKANRQILRTIHDHLEEVINARIASPRNGVSFLDRMLPKVLNRDVVLSIAELQEELENLIFAGHDTVATSVMFALYSLASHPEHQKRAYEEIESVLGNAEASISLTVEAVSKLHWLDCCIKESLRLYSTVPYIGRTLSHDTQVCGYKLAAGEIVYISLFGVLHSVNPFGEPFTFRPERFEHGRNDLHPFAHIPFSGGPRNCIGKHFALLEEKVLLSTLLRAFEFSTELLPSDLTLSGEIILKTKQKIVLTYVPR